MDRGQHLRKAFLTRGVRRKLPCQRVDELVASGDGERFALGYGRLMREWLEVHRTASMDCLALAREALAFLGSQCQDRWAARPDE